MAIPRLPEAANPFTLEITVNVKLRPYFEIWYQRMKRQGETPEQFAIRALKTAALNDYLQMHLPAEQQAVEEAKAAAEAAVNADIQSLDTEID